MVEILLVALIVALLLHRCCAADLVKFIIFVLLIWMLLPVIPVVFLLLLLIAMAV